MKEKIAENFVHKKFSIENSKKHIIIVFIIINMIPSLLHTITSISHTSYNRWPEDSGARTN